MYDETTGKRIERHGQPVRRKPGTAPCAFGKCKKGSPADPAILTPQNEQAYEHYLQCKATSSFPDDPLVKRNAAAIMVAEDHARAEIDRLNENAKAAKSLATGV